MINQIQKLGRTVLNSIERLGRGHLFLFNTLTHLGGLLLRPTLLIKQIYSVGVQTLIIILVAGFFVGMVLGLQAYYALIDFGAEDAISIMVVLTLLRELGPVVTALLFAGRAGSALTAEIGLMKATEQLSGLEMMAVNPMERIIAPRFMAGLISMPLLAAIFSAVGVLGAYLVTVHMLGLDGGSFWSQAQAKVDIYLDLMNGMIKAFIFGIVVVWIAVFEGYDCIPTSEGLGQATTRTVIHSSLAVLVLDFLLTAMMFAK